MTPAPPRIWRLRPEIYNTVAPRLGERISGLSDDDVYGNVAEWCLDTPIRGGSWASVPENCRSAYRDHFTSRNEQNFIGYRLVIQRTPD